MVLAPVLFLLHINDIPDDISVKRRLYAGDSVIYSDVNYVNDQIKHNDDFDKVKRWCNKWQMCINHEKSVCMTVTNKTKPLSFFII